jgi:hypothetical protein
MKREHKAKKANIQSVKNKPMKTNKINKQIKEE